MAKGHEIPIFVRIAHISKMVMDTMLDSKEVRYEITHGLSIGTMTFDLG